MVKINLQLFAQTLNKTTSIVDYLKSQGQDSSFNARKDLATKNGIQNYTGTAEQNNQLLGILNGGSKSPGGSGTTSGPKGGGNSTGNSGGASGGTSPKTTSGAKINGVSQSTMDVINTPFQSSTAYQEAMKYTNQLLEQLSSGRTSYTDQINTLMEQIQNRDKFEYDVDQDMLFQQYLTSSMASGKTAMQDTIGQAASLTGGYGSSYATSAGNQQYNAYIQDAYNNLPEYYNLALEAYQMEGEEMYNQLGMLNQADATEYERLYNSWNANFSNAQNMYQNEYSAWQDTINNAFNVAGMQNSDYWNSKEMGYKYAALKQDQDQFDKNFDLNQQEMLFKYDVNGDGVVDAKDKEVEAAEVKLESPSSDIVNAAKKIYLEKGEEAYIDWLATLPENVDLSELDAIVSGQTYQVPVTSRTFKKIGNGSYEDEYGNTFTKAKLKEAGFTDKEIKEIEALEKNSKWKR